MADALGDLDVRTLTPQIKVMSRVIGMTQAYRFLSAFGGQKIELPKHITEFDHPIALILGIDDANKLCHNWYDSRGNCDIKLEVPMLGTILLALRKSKICALKKTRTSDEIARDLGLTRRYVKSFLAEHCQDRERDCLDTSFQDPALGPVLFALRKSKICALKKTRTHNQIAREFGLTNRYVRRFLARHCQDCEQDRALKKPKTPKNKKNGL